MIRNKRNTFHRKAMRYGVLVEGIVGKKKGLGLQVHDLAS